MRDKMIEIVLRVLVYGTGLAAGIMVVATLVAGAMGLVGYLGGPEG